MAAAKNKAANLWSIVLTDGRGQGLTTLVKRWLRHCGTKSHQTIAKIQSSSEPKLDGDPIFSPHRRVTVVAQEDLTTGWLDPRNQESSRILVQPQKRGNAAAVFLGLTYVMAEDPEAIVLVYPSDHFIYPEAQFAKIASSATKIARELKQWMILLGIRPEKFETEYGWIQPGPTMGWTYGCHLRRIEALLDKSNVKNRSTALANGCLCNTSILAASATSLWAAAEDSFPEMLRLFQEYAGWIGSSQEETKLTAAYEKMPVLDFSMDILQSILSQVVVIELSSLVWSDWRKPQWLADSLRVISKPPAFAAEDILKEFKG
jgi:mannose-1-phosphate guanylyltransferase